MSNSQRHATRFTSSNKLKEAQPAFLYFHVPLLLLFHTLLTNSLHLMSTLPRFLLFNHIHPLPLYHSPQHLLQVETNESSIGSSSSPPRRPPCANSYEGGRELHHQAHGGRHGSRLPCPDCSGSRESISRRQRCQSEGRILPEKPINMSHDW